jgi:hypothetical protein
MDIYQVYVGKQFQVIDRLDRQFRRRMSRVGTDGEFPMLNGKGYLIVLVQDLTNHSLLPDIST